MIANAVQWILGAILILSSLGVVFARKPVYAALSFLMTLFTLSVLYLQIACAVYCCHAILVYAGAILVIFMYVIILFQDAYQHIKHHKMRSSPILLILAGASFFCALVLLGKHFIDLPKAQKLYRMISELYKGLANFYTSIFSFHLKRLSCFF